MEARSFFSMATYPNLDGISPHGASGAGGPSLAWRVAEFQRNCSFLAFILVVVMLCLLLLIGSLQSVLLPLIWAGFFALPLERAVQCLSQAEIGLFSSVLRLCREPQSESAPVPFWYVPGRNAVRVESTDATLALLAKVNNPLSGRGGCPCRRRVLGDAPPAAPGRVARTFTSCCRRRVRIHQLQATPPGPNQLQQGALYHVDAIRQSMDGMISLELCVDGHARYPAIFDEEDVVEQEARGTLEVDKTSALSWMCAIFFVIVLVIAGIMIFASLIFFGAQTLEDNFQDYVNGVNEFFTWASEKFKHLLPPEQWESIRRAIGNYFQRSLPVIAEYLLDGISSFLMQSLFMIIYLLFWLSEPIPVSPSVTEVFKTYLLLKTCVCLLFATLMSLVLWGLNVKIWPLFFVLSFLLNYIPEIGSMLCGALSVFVVLFDGSTPTAEQRAWNALILMFLFGIIKVATANVIEMRLYANKGGEFMRMHPVVLLAMMFIGEALLGLSGLFLSVPITAALKYYILTADMPSTFLDPMLVAIEGDEMAPHRNYVDKRRAEERRKEEEKERQWRPHANTEPQRDVSLSPLLAS